jgi:hypothetical protein
MNSGGPSSGTVHEQIEHRPDSAETAGSRGVALAGRVRAGFFTGFAVIFFFVMSILMFQ